MWENCHDPDFEEKADAILHLYLGDFEGHTVLCFDEKPGIQATERLHPSHPVRPGKAERVEYFYRRHGTVDVLAFFNVNTGEVLGRTRAHHKTEDFLVMLNLAVRKYPRGRIDIVLDNLSVHSTPEVKAWLKKHPRVHFTFTPKHASWMNQIEIWFSILERQLIKRGSFSSKKDLSDRIQGFIRQWNQRAKPFKWTWKGWPLAA
jgi:transposase